MRPVGKRKRLRRILSCHILVENYPVLTHEWLIRAIACGKRWVLLVEEDPNSLEYAIIQRTVRTTGMVVGPCVI